MMNEWKYTDHYMRDNGRRESKIREIGEGEIIAKFYWDRGHGNGAEWHYLTANGIIVIVNVVTNLVCTKLIARIPQVMRYREMGMRNELNGKTKNMRNWIVPNRVICACRYHENMMWNIL